MGFKKFSSVIDRGAQLEQDINTMNLDIDENPDVFVQIENFKKTILEIQKESIGLPNEIKKDILGALKYISRSLDKAMYLVFEQCIESNISDRYLTLNFMVMHPHIFSDNITEKIDEAINVHAILWHIIAHRYLYVDSPQSFVELSKNIPIYSADEKIQLFISLGEEIIDTTATDILSEIAVRDDQRKKTLVADIRTQYPQASKKVDYILLSKNKRSMIQKDFLILCKKELGTLIHTKASEFISDSFYDDIASLSVLLMVFFDGDQVATIFNSYVSLFLEQEFQKSDQQNKQKYVKITSSPAAALASVLAASQEPQIKVHKLPDGLKDDIRNYFSGKKMNGSAGKMFSLIEKILQKNLAKGKYIRKQRFKEKMASYGLHCIGDDFFLILEKHGFCCVDTTKPSKEQSHEDTIISQMFGDIPEAKNAVTTNPMLMALDAYDTLERLPGESKHDYLVRKITGYAAIFEQVGYIFDNRDKFVQIAAEYCHSNIRLDKDIKRVIYDIIVKDKKELAKDGLKYYAFALPKGWRIVLSKKGVIDTICPHDYYEKYLRNNFR